ncbi:unnamed protein product [marine sediment metagenome]|uniref:Uncharacterized protein n=1 Tax=marine sediment metagenome TaxID=412755 RepID=X0VP59_9ZZZZ
MLITEPNRAHVKTEQNAIAEIVNTDIPTYNGILIIGDRKAV